MSSPRKSLVLGLFAVTLFSQCSRPTDSSETEPGSEGQAPLTPLSVELAIEEKMRRLVASEEWILALTPQLKRLGQDLKQAHFPGPESLDLFSEQLAWTDLSEPVASLNEEGALPVVNRLTFSPRSPETIVAVKNGLLWKSVLRDIERIEKAKFYFYSADPAPNNKNIMQSHVGFEGLAQLRNGHWRSFTGKQTLWWMKTDDKWRISKWVQEELTAYETPELFFEEMLEDSLANGDDYQRARTSYHEQNLIQLFTDGSFPTTDPVYARYQDLESAHQHPALSVVDIDRDGWDELYVMGRWGKNQLFQRGKDGRYRDIAPRLNLDFEGYCNAALFADFDNDGDPDVFIGRSLKRSLYLENIDGQFVDRSSEKTGVPLPYLVSSLSAADYNNDGLLDIYFGLYGPTAQDTPPSMWADEFFPPAMARELLKRAENSHRYLDLLGPPNLLLENHGDRFVVAPSAGVMAEWRNTYQSAWSDFDNDGDMDLYVCNDFAPDALFRNNGPNQKGQYLFTEISREVAGESMMGFGMGATWDDYDRDGHIDLYVSNMFSKAGRRITSQIEGLDHRVPYSSQGSYLFRNEGGTFRQRAGLNADDMHVAKVGWSFGGLFVDADNDGYPDIYSASGYYTAPKATHSTQDL